MASTWKLNSTVTYSYLGTISVNFTNNGLEYDRFSLIYDSMRTRYRLRYLNTTPYRETVVSQSSTTTLTIASTYRTLIFEERPTGALLTWLESNAVEQGGGTKNIKFGSNNIDGIRLGNDTVSKIYVGINLIWEVS